MNNSNRLNPFNFEYKAGEGLQVQINKDELPELLEDDKKEQARLEDLDIEQELSDEQQGYRDTGMRPSDFD